jgi:hypothetical protein
VNFWVEILDVSITGPDPSAGHDLTYDCLETSNDV